MSTINPDKITGTEALALRKTKGLNQGQFWAPIGVTQSAGSRYEAGRDIPKPVRLLMAIAYGDKPYKVVAKIRGEKV